MKASGYIIYPGKLTVVDSFRIGCIGRMDHYIMQGVVDAAARALTEMGVQDASPLKRHLKNANDCLLYKLVN